MQEKANNIFWVEPELDFEELFTAGRYEDLIRLSDENSNLVLSLFQQSETKELKQSLNIGTVILSYFERALKKSIEFFAVFCAGKLKGYLDAIDRLQFARESEKMTIERAKLLGTKHLNEIILALETHGSLSHSELSDLLNLRASTLTEVLKKVKQVQLVNSSPYGKYKIYSLTSEGVKYGAILRRKHQPDMEATIDAVQSYLRNQNLRDSFINALNNRLSTTSDTLLGNGSQFYLCVRGDASPTKLQVQNVLHSISNSLEESTPVFLVHKDIPFDGFANNTISRKGKVGE